MTTLVLSVIGSDRPGLTQALAGAIAAARGNWLDSRLSHLGGLFVGSALVEVDADKVEARLENGVLSVRLAKHEAAKPRKINVKAE